MAIPIPPPDTPDAHDMDTPKQSHQPTEEEKEAGPQEPRQINDQLGDQPVFRYELRIPKDRIAVLIGKGGQIKDKLEDETGATIQVDSKEGDVFIEGHDVLSLYQLRDMVKAVGRGFNPETAFLLLRQDYTFELIQLKDYSPHQNHQQRIKGRVIGRAGKTRHLIEQLTDVFVTIYGKTIGIIGPIENVTVAGRAIDMLLSGSPHANVYKWLEQKRKTLKRIEMVGPDIEVKDEFKKYVDEQ
ncbi:MAG: KH domain-containing protein [Nanoarchaeota archaeon]